MKPRMTIEQMRQVNGESVVMIRSWQGSMAQYRVMPQAKKAPGADAE